MIPKFIWSYWNDENLPDLVNLCVQTWKKMNPNYTITILNENNYNQYIDTNIKSLKHYSKKEHQRTADFIRLAVLKKHGGIWIDSSTICIRPLNFGPTVEFFAYYLNNPGTFYTWKFPAIENWFIACSKNNEFISKWHDEFLYETEKYETMDLYRIHANIELPIVLTGGYFAMHVAAQVVLKNMYDNGIEPKLTLRNALGDGPFELIHGEFSVNICNADFDKLKANIIKLRGTERKYMKKNKDIEQCIFNKIKEILNKPVPKTYNIEKFGTNDLDKEYNAEYPYTNIMKYQYTALRLIVLIIGLVLIIILLSKL